MKISLIEDNPYDVDLLRRELTKSGITFSMQVVETKNDFIDSLIHFKPDIVLSDHSLPGFNSIEALKLTKEIHSDTPFILVSGAVSEEFAIEIISSGADDYILKTSLKRLSASISNAFYKKEIKKEKEIIESLHKELTLAYGKIEERNRNITDSISYAKRIQETILPDKKSLSDLFPRSFILFKPKDIVSGDFYWFVKHDNKIIIVVADCTGHGVPGALMSMIGYNLLNQIVTVKNISDPGKILKRLNKGMQFILKQNGSDKQTPDGMDIAICIIDKQNHTLEFAGANRPLYYFKNKEFKIISGNKYGIGGLHTDKVKDYSYHTQQFEPEDSIYMFTDGYSDQFGGENNKKMMRGNFIKLLQNTQSTDFTEQEKLLDNWLTEWQGLNEQTDDILLIGIQL